MHYCSYLGQPLVIVTIVPFLNNLGLSWCSVKMAHCGGFVRKPRKRLESTQCSCTTACCGDGVSLLLYPKASLKIRTANAIFCISLGILRDYCLKIFFVFQERKLKLSVKISTHSAYSDNCYFLSYGLSDWVETLWGFTKFYFKQMLKVLFLKKIFFKP